jgi:anti-sigma factor RsiW
MDPCNEDCVTILRYLANELSGPQLEEFSAHLKTCTECGAYLEEEQILSRLLHRARPLFSAPVAIRSRVSTMLVEHSAPKRAPRWLH